MLTADLLRNLGVVLCGTAFGLAVAVNVEAVRRRRLETGTPRAGAWQFHLGTLYAVGMHTKAAAVNIVRFGDTAIDAQLIAFVSLGAVGNVALLLMLQVITARRLLAERAGRRCQAGQEIGR